MLQTNQILLPLVPEAVSNVDGCLLLVPCENPDHYTGLPIGVRIHEPKLNLDPKYCCKPSIMSPLLWYLQL